MPEYTLIVAVIETYRVVVNTPSLTAAYRLVEESSADALPGTVEWLNRDVATIQQDTHGA